MQDSSDIAKKQQRPSLNTEAAKHSSSTTPKVVLRPRTRLNIAEGRETETAAARVKRPSQYPSRKRTAVAPVPMAPPKGAQDPTERDFVKKEEEPRIDEAAPKDRINLEADGQANSTGLKTSDGTAENQQTEIKREEADFMNWCKQVLGVYTILEIQTFPYDINFVKSAAPDWEDDMLLTNEEKTVTAKDTISVRGLAAAQDIAEGETVIRIPLQALLSVATSIDQDPVLSSVMGFAARKLHGWDDVPIINSAPISVVDGESAEEEPHFYELPLLAVALLHHRRLGTTSPMSLYIRILIRSPVDSMPFLWSAEKIKSAASEGVRIVARGIRQEIRTMYERVVLVLVKKHPDIFGPLKATDASGEWMFSYEMFQWAFAIVNSRHWQLPIEDLMAEHHTTALTPASSASKVSPVAPALQGQVPPADTPTESWVLEHGDVDDDISVNKETSRERKDDSMVNNKQLMNMAHSFLAPVADLLNFGPPCTRVRYNKESRTFEVIATCAFKKGQEVTFWYSNECDDVMVAVYGFSHPLVPQCKSSEEWRLRSNAIEEKLKDAHKDMKMLEDELEYVEAILDDCDCCDEKEKHEEHSSRLRHEDPTTHSAAHRSDGNGSSRRSRERRERSQRVRRTWTEF